MTKGMENHYFLGLNVMAGEEMAGRRRSTDDHRCRTIAGPGGIEHAPFIIHIEAA